MKENLVDRQVVPAWHIESKISGNIKKFSHCPSGNMRQEILLPPENLLLPRAIGPMELLSPAHTLRNTLDIYYSVSSNKTPMDYMSLWGSGNGNEYPIGAHKNLLVHFYPDIYRATAALVQWHQRKTKSGPLSIQKNNVIPKILLRPLQTSTRVQWVQPWALVHELSLPICVIMMDIINIFEHIQN